MSDVVMPGLGGPDLAQRIVPRRPTIKVLFVSGYITPETLDVGLSSRHASYLQKPFGPEALARKVREHLDSQVGSSGGECWARER